ncbi:MAG: anthranilate phosphoribosyltransferase [bacterium]
MLKEALREIVERKDLDEKRARAVMMEIMSGAATDAQIGAFIAALRMKGETVAEITGFARAMREKANRVVVKPAPSRGNVVLDTCGTGGDGAGTFNVSTLTAFVAAAAGVRVAKHGNRAVSSRCGSADLLMELGAKLDAGPETVAAMIERIGIGFLFAPAFHPAMKYAAGPRRETGIRTVFNVLGPLTNPAGANVQLLGVYCAGRAGDLARVLGKLGSLRAMVVSGEDGLDEITLSGKTLVAELRGGRVRKYELKPEDFGMKCVTRGALRGGDAARNAAIARDVFSGKKGAHRNAVILNSAAALYVSGAAKNVAEGARLAAETIDSGAARRKLDQFLAACKS